MMKINKNLISNGIIVALALAAAFRDTDICLLFATIFFIIIMTELQQIKDMIKNIPPWY